MGQNQMELKFLSCLGLYFMALCVLFVRCVIIDNTFQHPEISPLKTGPPGGHLLSLFIGSDKNEL